MRNRLLALILGFLGVALVGFAQTAPTRVMNFHTKDDNVGKIDLTYYISNRGDLYNMMSDQGTFTNIVQIDGNDEKGKTATTLWEGNIVFDQDDKVGNHELDFKLDGSATQDQKDVLTNLSRNDVIYFMGYTGEGGSRIQVVTYEGDNWEWTQMVEASFANGLYKFDLSTITDQLFNDIKTKGISVKLWNNTLKFINVVHDNGDQANSTFDFYYGTGGYWYTNHNDDGTTENVEQPWVRNKVTFTVGTETKRQGQAKWQDRYIGQAASTSNLNPFGTVKVICQNGYGMDENYNDGGNKGDMEMLNGIYAEVLDLSQSTIGTTDVPNSGWHMDYPEPANAETTMETTIPGYDGPIRYFKAVIQNNHHTLKEVWLPANTDVIGFEAFSNCHSLQRVYMPDVVKVIGSHAFGDCPELTTIRFFQSTNNTGANLRVMNTLQVPAELRYIGARAFWGDTKLMMKSRSQQSGEDINTTPADNFSFIAGGDDNSSSKLIGIGDYAFCNVPNIAKTVEFPKTVERIGRYAFANARTGDHGSSAPSITTKFKFDAVDANHNTTIEDYAFSQQDNFTSDFTSADADADNVSTPLTEVEFGAGNYSIGAGAFANDVMLKRVDVSNVNSITNIGAYAFYNCRSLTKNEGYTTDQDNANNINQILAKTDGSTTLGHHAFANCNGIPTANNGGAWTSWYRLDIPASWTSIPAGMFENDFNLTQVYVTKAEAPTTEKTVSDDDFPVGYPSLTKQTIVDFKNSTACYPFHGIVANRCQLVFSGDAGTGENYVSYRNQPGFLDDILTKYLYEYWEKDDYYCAKQEHADIYLHRTFNTTPNCWNTCALPFAIGDKETLTNALGDNVEVAVFAKNKDAGIENWQVSGDGSTLHFIRLNWHWKNSTETGGTYGQLDWGLPFIVKNVSADKWTKHPFTEATLKDGKIQTVTYDKFEEGYHFSNVLQNASELGNGNWGMPAENHNNNGTYFMVYGKFYSEHIDLGKDNYNKFDYKKDFWFINDNKFYCTTQVTRGHTTGERKFWQDGFRFYIYYDRDANNGHAQWDASDNGGNAKSVLNFGVDEDGEATGIDQAKIVIDPDPSESEKVKAYNLQGQVVGSGYKGIVIVNGKKIVRK